jgi:hypothetical protein
MFITAAEANKTLAGRLLLTQLQKSNPTLYQQVMGGQVQVDYTHSSGFADIPGGNFLKGAIGAGIGAAAGFAVSKIPGAKPSVTATLGGNASSNPSPTIMQQKAGAAPGGVSPAQASINPQGSIGGKTAMVTVIGIVAAISLAFAFKGVH